jgi:hypothetical protein
MEDVTENNGNLIHFHLYLDSYAFKLLVMVTTSILICKMQVFFMSFVLYSVEGIMKLCG